MSRSIDAVLFDLGGVVFNIDFERMLARWADHSGDDARTMRERFSFDEFYARHERGEIPASEYFASLRRTLQVDLSDAQFADGWNAIYLDEAPGMSQLLWSVKDQIPLYAFTNSNPIHMAVCTNRYQDALANFRRVFVSSELGFRKPEPEAFEAIGRSIGVWLNRILFFDDTLTNVEGAAGVGMKAIHVSSHADVAGVVSRTLRAVL
jgi:glucose-1-phosphatase